jgi:hypothetical protein
MTEEVRLQEMVGHNPRVCGPASQCGQEFFADAA